MQINQTCSSCNGFKTKKILQNHWAQFETLHIFSYLKFFKNPQKKQKADFTSQKMIGIQWISYRMPWKKYHEAAKDDPRGTTGGHPAPQQYHGFAADIFLTTTKERPE